MPSVPDRWLKYSCYGRTLIDKFVALKVPLSRQKIGVPPRERFTPEDAIARLPLGLIIDLTNTAKYYDPCDFTSKGVDHVKITVPGHMIPKQRTVERFNEIVNGYFNDPSSKGKLIGVHCTHGLNRTGYLVCAYMILELGYHPSDAIQMFNANRGHNMERDNYLQSLRSMVPGRNASRSSDHDVVSRERTMSRSTNSRAANRGENRAVKEQDRISWRQDRPSGRQDRSQRQYGTEPSQQHRRTSSTYAMEQYRYNNNDNSQYTNASPDYHQERWDPTIRRIVRSREHNFRVPSHRQTGAHGKVYHTRFE